MKTFFENTAARAKEFVADHKTAIIVTTTATATFLATAALARTLNKSYNETVDEFIAEHGLTEKFNELFYDPTEDLPVS